MGNRAVITVEGFGCGIYLHWDGGPESVLAFCEVARRRGFRDPTGDPSYALARLCGLMHEFCGTHESTSLGIGPLAALDTSDNGIYYLGKGWTIAARDPAGGRKTLRGLDGAQRERYEAIVERLDTPKPPED